MKKSSKIGLTVLLILIILIAVLFVWALPFSLVFTAWNTNDKDTQLSHLRNAVKYSLFTPQKAYAIEAIMPTLVIYKNYDEAIKYYEEYKKIDANRDMKNAIKRLAVLSYIQSEDYDSALKLAKELNSKKLQKQIYKKKGKLK